MTMVEVKKFIEVSSELLKSGKEISFDDKAFEAKLVGKKAADGDGVSSDLCTAFDSWANDYFRQVCSSKHKTIRGLFDSSKQDACVQADIPYLAPSITLRWADSPNDHLETEDIETFCLTARNPYQNVTFNSFEISTSFLINPNWQMPPDNNDGTPSSKMTPAHKICFGDLGPCGSVSREIQLVNRNALPGRYFWLVAFCSNWSVNQIGIEAFPLDYELS